MKKKIFVSIGVVLLLANVVLFVVLFINSNRQMEAVAYSQSEVEKVDQELEAMREQLKYGRISGFYVLDMLGEIYDDKVSKLEEGEKMAIINLSFGSMRRGLKYINDEYGHYYGNGAVNRFASIIKEVYNEKSVTYIYGTGSNFFLVVEDVKDRESLMKKAEMFKEKWHDTPYIIEGIGEVSNLSLYINMYLIDGNDKDVELKEIRSKLGDNKDVMRDKGNLGIEFVN